jgi:hypothetical protein
MDHGKGLLRLEEGKISSLHKETGKAAQRAAFYA